MFIQANLTNIPLSALIITRDTSRTCWNGLLLNLTQYYDFPANENSSLTRALTGAWRKLFSAAFQNISSEELVDYFSEAKETTDLYNNYTIPCLRSCLTGTRPEGQTGFRLLDPTSNETLYWEEFPTVVRIDCKLLRIAGNPNIGGIGLFSAYITIVTIFTLLTIAHVFLLSMRYKRSHLRSYLHSKWESALNAASLAFLDSATFLSISLLVAGVSYMRQTDSYYESTLSVAVSGISATPLLTLTVVMYPTFRRKPLRIVIASVAALLYCVHGIYSLSMHSTSITILATLGLCLLVLGVLYGSKFPRLTGCWRRLVHSMPRNRKTNKSKTDSSQENTVGSKPKNTARIHLLLPLGFMLWGQALAWTNLYSIVEMRRFSVQNRSNNNSENELSYGQVVSLFIWLPVCVDFLYTALYGSKEGLEGNIPIPFIVEDHDENDASVVVQNGSHVQLGELFAH